MAVARPAPYRQSWRGATQPMEASVMVKRVATALVAILVIAALATWMLAGEDPPVPDEPVLEAG